MMKAVTQSEETHIKEQEQAKARDKQLRLVRQTNRSGFNYFTPTNSTPIRNDNTRTDPPWIHFNTNPTCHIYSTTSDSNDHYEPPVNDSLIQMAASTHTKGQPIRPERQVTIPYGDAMTTRAQSQTQ